MADTDIDLALLSDMARDWVTQTCPATPDHQAARDALPATWSGMREMGWPGAAVAEEDGGSGLGLRGMDVLLRALGRELAASPLLSTGLLGPYAIGRGMTGARRRTLLGQLARGETIFALAINESGRFDPWRVETTATPQGERWSLTGCKRFVLDGSTADVLLVAAEAPDGLGLFLVPAEQAIIEPVDTVDGRAFAHVRLQDAVVDAEDRLEVAATDLAAELLALARLGLASEMVGACERAIEITVEQLKTRQQFGRPIGAFQALQHRAAAMQVGLELARSCVEAAWRAADEPEYLAELALVAKYAAGEALHLASNEIVQMHGGMGMTAEHVAGRYLKWARVSEALYGSASRLADEYAGLKGF